MFECSSKRNAFFFILILVGQKLLEADFCSAPSQGSFKNKVFVHFSTNIQWRSGEYITNYKTDQDLKGQQYSDPK